MDENQTNSITSAMIVDGTIIRTDITPTFKAPFSDTADYARSTPPVGYIDSARVSVNAYNAYKLQDKDTLALSAKYVDEGQVNSITSAMIVDNAITTGKILDGAITTAKIADNNVTTAKITDNAITTGKIQDGQVQTVDIADTNITMPKIQRAGATTGQVLKWTGSAWAPRNDSVVSGVGVYLPLTGGTMTGAITSTGDPEITMGKANFGSGNLNPGTQAFVAGQNNRARGAYSVVSGGGGSVVGDSNSAIGVWSVISGGTRNTTRGTVATISGGIENTANGTVSTVSGGELNTASGSYASVGGGKLNTASGDYAATVSGGWGNTASGQYATVGGGQVNTANHYAATVGGGHLNTASGSYATVGGGHLNTASGPAAIISGGWQNTATSFGATVGGGERNTVSGFYATVGGGVYDTVMAHFGGVFSGYNNLAGDDINDSAAVVTGGRDNRATARYSFIGGGQNNRARGIYSVVAGGGGATLADSNSARGDYSAIGGGTKNTASGTYALVGGGRLNTASGWWSTVGGGDRNTASGTDATVSGGYLNTAYGSDATVGGGYADSVRADYSFAVGNRSIVASGHTNSAAFNGQTTTASGQTRVGVLSKASGTFTIDHPLDPMNKILNHYFVESPEMVLIYRGSAIIGADGKAQVNLPNYFDALNENPMVQLTGVGSSDVYVSEEVRGNRFVIGGKPGIKVYWIVTGARKDQSAEITKLIMPVEQSKTGELSGRSLDDDFLVTTMQQLEAMGQGHKFNFRTASARQRYQDNQQRLREIKMNPENRIR